MPPLGAVEVSVLEQVRFVDKLRTTTLNKVKTYSSLRKAGKSLYINTHCGKDYRDKEKTSPLGEGGLRFFFFSICMCVCDSVQSFNNRKRSKPTWLL